MSARRRPCLACGLSANGKGLSRCGVAVSLRRPSFSPTPDAPPARASRTSSCINVEPGRDSPPDRCDTAHRFCIAREKGEDTAGLSCDMEPRCHASPPGFCGTAPASCDTALAGRATQFAGGAAQFAWGVSQSEGCVTQFEGSVTQFEGGVTQSTRGATQLEGGATQFAGAVPQFEGGVSQLARAETREVWALAAESGA